MKFNSRSSGRFGESEESKHGLDDFPNREFNLIEADGIRKMFPVYATAEINFIELNALLKNSISLSLHCDHVEIKASITVLQNVQCC